MHASSFFYRLKLLGGTLLLFAAMAPARTHAQGKIVLTSHNPVLRVSDRGLGILDATADTKILWKREDVPTKITVQTMCPGQSFFLAVRAVSLTTGISAGEVSLRDGMPPTDLIVHIPAGGNRMEQAHLLYVAAATVAQGNSDEEGADSHVVTYTLVQQ